MLASVGAVQHPLGRGHRSDAPACLIEHLAGLIASGLSCGSEQQRLQDLHVVLDAMIELVEQQALLRLRLPAFADIDQHVDGADHLSRGSRSGVGNGMKGMRVPSGRSATASALRMARPSFRATAIGHSSWGNGVPSGR